MFLMQINVTMIFCANGCPKEFVTKEGLSRHVHGNAMPATKYKLQVVIFHHTLSIITLLP